MNTTRKNHTDIQIAVTPEEAATLLFHHLDIAAAFFEAGPMMPELVEAFKLRYPDMDALGAMSKLTFLRELNQEYIDKFDDEAEAEAEVGEGE